MRRSLLQSACLALLCVATLLAQAPGRRLVLKDGSYQIVAEYQVQGDRVRYRSAERGGEWEELPASLVDWDATHEWEREHRVPEPGKEPASGAEQDAATIDRETARERDAERARQPIVAPGLRLPDESGVWGFDNFRDTPELVRVSQSLGNLNRGTGHTVAPAPVPGGGAREWIRMDDPRAKVQFHVPQPVFFLSVDVPDDVAPESAMVVHTGGAPREEKSTDKHERSDPHSQYAVIKLQLDRKSRVVSGAELSGLARPDGTGAIIRCRAELLPGGRWLKVTPAAPLDFGEYALVELLGPTTLNLDTWDFGIDPRAGENHKAFAPVTSSRTEEP